MEALLLSLLVLATSIKSAAAQNTGGKIAPTFSTTPKFHHRAYHATIVLGDYLYLDGGEIATWNGIGNGTQFFSDQNGTKNGDIYNLPSNWTYSLPLNQPWNNSTVTLTPIPKSSFILNDEALWLDASGKFFYSFDGSESQALKFAWEGASAPTTPQFYQFTPSGGGGGSWEAGSVSGSSIEPNLINLYNTYNAYGNGLGFALGGMESDWSDYTYNDQYYDSVRYLAGMVMYNSSSQEWFNVSTSDYTTGGLAVYGAAQFVPSFGPEGLLLVLGGERVSAGDVLVPLSLDVISIFEPVSKTWQKQLTTGSPPASVQDTCVVGVEGDNSTYEIFLYGGQFNYEVEPTANLGAVWVLSLPSFHWVRQPDPLKYSRWKHSCAVVGSQMISTGGVVIRENTPSTAFYGGVDDPWDQGIGVFDLSGLEWQTSYNPDAAAYSTPTLIKEYIAQNGEYPTSWGSDTVQHWFVAQAKNSTSSNPPSPSPGPSSSSDVGAIAGGVVGGVVGILLIAGVLWYLIRRKRKERVANAWNNEPARDGREMREAGPGSKAGQAGPQLPGKHNPAEHGGSQLYELEGQQHERPAWNR